MLHRVRRGPVGEKIVRTLARNVRRRRKLARMTFKAAAELAGVSWRHWQKVEHGETAITVVTLAKLASALGVTPAELLS